MAIPAQRNSDDLPLIFLRGLLPLAGGYGVSLFILLGILPPAGGCGRAACTLNPDALMKETGASEFLGSCKLPTFNFAPTSLVQILVLEEDRGELRR